MEQALGLIELYRARRGIKLFFVILKEGCRIQALQLGRLQRIDTALTPSLMVA